MIKRLSIPLLLVAIMLAHLYVLPTQEAAALYTSPCNWQFGTVCGYFNSKVENANCNVLPGGNVGTWCKQGDVSVLYGHNNYSDFTNTIKNFVNINATDGWDTNARIGAAFIIDIMLGGPNSGFNTGTNNGVNLARANLNTWLSRMADFNAPKNSTYGINWSYTPSYGQFCPTSGWELNTAYDQFNKDAVFYPVNNSNNNPNSGNGLKCKNAWLDMQPEIVFWWNNGASSIAIGTRCGNIVQADSPLPAPNNLPWGTISLTCDLSTGQQSATVKFGDADGPGGNSWAAVYTNGQQVKFMDPSYNASVTPVTFPIPTSMLSPYASQGVTLYVYDAGPLGSGQYIAQPSVTSTPCVTVNCLGAAASPSPLDPYMRYSLTVSASSTSSSPPPNPSISLDSIVSPGGASYGSQPQMAATPSGSSVSATFANTAPTSSIGGSGTGTYTAHWSVYSNGTFIKQCSGTFPVVDLPYVNVYGGDAMAGASPDYSGTSSSCATNSNGGLYGWNSLGGTYYGAGAQYAIQALGANAGFASALQSSNDKPDGLSFANSFTPPDSSKESPGSGLFGGYFGDTSGNWTGSCDFTSDLTGAQQVNGAKSFSATSVLANNDVWEVTGGDVYIGGNITYGTTSWASLSAIPYFKLVVVGGDIYINSGVTELDGLYVSESAGGVGGHIYTCASAPSTAVTPTTANYFNTCHNPLAIYGAFVAKQVQFARTYGSLGQASGDSAGSNHDAEVFYYSPELWLPRSNSLPGNGYSAITGLPPVL